MNLFLFHFILFQQNKYVNVFSNFRSRHKYHLKVSKIFIIVVLLYSYILIILTRKGHGLLITNFDPLTRSKSTLKNIVKILYKVYARNVNMIQLIFDITVDSSCVKESKLVIIDTVGMSQLGINNRILFISL